MGPAKIKRWLEKRGIAVNSVATVKVTGSPIITSYQITTKNGKKGKLAPNARQHDLENLAREFSKV